jgi:hypothetical protein
VRQALPDPTQLITSIRIETLGVHARYTAAERHEIPEFEISAKNTEMSVGVKNGGNVVSSSLSGEDDQDVSAIYAKLTRPGKRYVPGMENGV